MDDKENKKSSDEELKSIQRKNSFSKNNSSQILNLTNDEEIPPPLTTRNISLQEKFSGKGVLPTIFDEKIKKLTKENSKIEENNYKKDDFLQVRKIKKISDDDFDLLYNNIVENEDLNLLYKDIITCGYLALNEIDYSSNVGCMLPFAYLVESLFNNNIISIEEMNDRYELFKNYIYNYRPIKGDGNCFYRAVIFRYFELIIIHKQIDLLKNIIYEIHESFNSNEIRSRLKIKYNFTLNCRLVLLILIIILNLLEEGKVQEAHLFFVKSMVIEDSFDYGLIIYFRYIFYLYIKQNENKIYLENFAIKIGNLLPSNYETDKGMFLFNKFYYLYLLSMFTDAEKIIIHLTPFVLGINLDVIIFNDNEDKTIKNMIYAGETDYKFNDDKIFVLNINGHYELLYSEEDNNKNIEIFRNYINDYYSNIRIKENKQENIKEEEDENEKYENNIVIESSSIPLKEQSDKKKEEDNLKDKIEKEKEEKEINNTNENKNKHKVQIKIINRTTKKPVKEKNDGNNIISDKIKYSEKKDINYQNLINNKNNEENLNKIEQANEENSTNNNGIYKSINTEKLNLLEKMNNEVNNEEDKNENKKNSKENEELKLSNKIIDNDNEDNIKDNSEIHLIQCKICKNNNIKENNNELLKDICKSCLKKKIINELNQKYFSHLENIISEKMNDPAFKTYFDEFLESKLKIFEKDITIKNVLNALDNKCISNLEMHPIFQEIKQNFCIFCLNNIEKTKYEIPCKCNFCSIDHIKKYFHLKNNFKNKSNYICICSHQYSLEDIYNIGIFFLQNKLYSLKEDIIDYLNHNYLEKQCCFCSVSLENYNKKRIKIKDFEDEIVLGDTNKLKHFQCFNCYLQYQYNVEIFSCFICNKNHMIIGN